MKVTNISPGPRGLNSTSGLVMLEKNETREVEISSAELKVSKATGWFAFDGKEPEEKRSQEANDQASAEAKKAAAKALLDQADDLHFQTFRKQAGDILGADSLPDKKDEIIAALEKAAA